VLPQAATLADDEPSCIVREMNGESKVNIIVLHGPSLCASFYEVGIGVVACGFSKNFTLITAPFGIGVVADVPSKTMPAVTGGPPDKMESARDHAG
jgi:copper oxidase (laccase) domain-containing protein